MAAWMLLEIGTKEDTVLSVSQTGTLPFWHDFQQDGAPLQYARSCSKYLDCKLINGQNGTRGEDENSVACLGSIFDSLWLLLLGSRERSGIFRAFGDYSQAQDKVIRPLRLSPKRHFKRCTKTSKTDFCL